MVGEGALEHACTAAGRRRRASRRTHAVPAGHHALALPALRRPAPATASSASPAGSSATRCAPSRSRRPRATRADGRRRRRHPCRSAVRRARGPRRPRAPAPRPSRRARSEQRFARPSGRVAVDDVDVEHPAGRAVVHAPPAADLAVGVADHEVLAGAQSLLGDLDQHVVLGGSCPAPAGVLVGTQQLVSRATTDGSSGSGAAASQPAGRPGSSGRISWVALRTGCRRVSQPLILPYARRGPDRTAVRPSRMRARSPR